MSVYVDQLRYPRSAPLVQGRARMWCHLVADTDDELEQFAVRLGLAVRWKQRGHYDIVESKRKLAVRLGAIEVSSREAVGIRKAGEGVPSTQTEA